MESFPQVKIKHDWEHRQDFGHSRNEEDTFDRSLVTQWRTKTEHPVIRTLENRTSDVDYDATPFIALP
ncbi:hypothetical protein EUGRSUZ_A01756 [Eucalyptus grandis]|uniref:Uncharacterized protein n=2 Tax=Eucalyptus grandis TaxID=71139 RepID=A0ACC3M4B5_EUCGR|nr:hypothetical protein EUGRSUZ_A01756 [Eucalyptus grandis]